jgi:phosphopantothenoylcysteine decarboxylase/phosphopantothenate--cysteine ligase
MQLNNKRILLAVTGSIAAYKSAILVRLLVKEGAEVQVIMTTSALDFITPLTLATLSKNPVHHQFYDSKTGVWTNHVDLGIWADLLLIAPISANTIAKLANGSCDNLLSAVYLSARCPVMLAPAMDLDMYRHPAVMQNLEKLVSYGNIVLDAESGELASGLSGQGRMMEPEHILNKVLQHFHTQQTLKGKQVLITSGPTQEDIDPVRFISNHSSGKMGAAIADVFADNGAQIHLILGPGAKIPQNKNIKIYPVRSASEMYEKAAALHSNMDICIFAAAVADYAPKEIQSQKIKKSTHTLTLDLVKNVDIALTLGKEKNMNQIHVGFALETENENAYAKAKLESKNFDVVVLNSTRDAGAGFQVDTNKVKLFFKDGRQIESDVKPKKEIAAMLLEAILSLPVVI